VDFTGRLVYVDGKKNRHVAEEYDLLFYLVKNRGIALTRENLITIVWGYDFYGDDRTLDTHIKLLRKSSCAATGLSPRFEGWDIALKFKSSNFSIKWRLFFYLAGLRSRSDPDFMALPRRFSWSDSIRPSR
jgi:hypothetical protein